MPLPKQPGCTTCKRSDDVSCGLQSIPRKQPEKLHLAGHGKLQYYSDYLVITHLSDPGNWRLYRPLHGVGSAHRTQGEVTNPASTTHKAAGRLAAGSQPEWAWKVLEVPKLARVIEWGPVWPRTRSLRLRHGCNRRTRLQIFVVPSRITFEAIAYIGRLGDAVELAWIDDELGRRP